MMGCVAVSPELRQFLGVFGCFYGKAYKGVALQIHKKAIRSV